MTASQEMTAREHYCEAERLLVQVAANLAQRSQDGPLGLLVAMAQVHATLAVVGAMEEG